jgi:hypothetical protein
MFWFVIIILIAMMCAGVISFAVGVKLLKFGEEAAQQEHTLRIVVISFIDILVGGFALAAVATKVVDPLVALIVTFIVTLTALLGFRISRR